jgi:hypothetical protein
LSRLEWQTTSPPPTENFLEMPVVTQEAYDYASIDEADVDSRHDVCSDEDPLSQLPCDCSFAGLYLYDVSTSVRSALFVSYAGHLVLFVLRANEAPFAIVEMGKFRRPNENPTRPKSQARIVVFSLRCPDGVGM